MISSGKLLALCCFLVSAHGRILDPSKALPSTSERCEQNSVTPVSCANVTTYNSLVPHPDDCELFYYCVQPHLPAVCRQCPSKLHFNPTLYVCDWPDQAGCRATNKTTEAATPINNSSTDGRTTTPINYPTTEANSTTHVPTTSETPTVGYTTTESYSRTQNTTTTQAPTSPRTTTTPTTTTPTTTTPTQTIPTATAPTTTTTTTRAPTTTKKPWWKWPWW